MNIDVKIVLLIALFCGSANAQLTDVQCIPGLDSASYTSDQFKIGVTANGQWARWNCTDKTTKKVTTTTLVGLKSQIPLIGFRVNTIMKAPDPLASLRSAGSRFVVKPLTDPTLSSIYDDAINSRGEIK
jgi:hypothetical protein